MCDFLETFKMVLKNGSDRAWILWKAESIESLFICLCLGHEDADKHFSVCLVISDFGSCNYYVNQPVQEVHMSYKQEVCSL